MSKIPYLYRRGNVFYFRAAVPTDLREDLQCREIVQSLKVEKRSEAVPLAFTMAAEVSKLFNRVRIMVDDNDDQKRSNGGQKRREWALREKLKIKDVLHQEELDRIDSKHRRELRRVSAESALKAENRALKTVLAGGVKSGDSEKDTPAKTQKSNAPLLSVAIDEFLSQWDVTKKAMLTKHKANLPVFLELIGDKPVDQIRHIDVSRFAVELRKFPARRTDRKFKGMDAKQMIAANDGECMHKKTFENYKSSVKALIVWARKKWDGAFETVRIDEIKYEGQRTGKEGGQRSFKDTELIKVFTCKWMKEHCENGREVHKFWLPVIGLFTGMRVNEICQLNPAVDIREDENGIWYFSVNDEGDAGEGIEKSVKTAAGVRVVPIHSKLIELGLLDYVGALKSAGHKQLFPQWKAKGGKAGDNAGRYFRRFLDEIGLRDETKGKKLVGMHAFRKTVVTRSYKGGFIRDMLPIIGHESDVLDETGKALPDVTMDYLDDEVLQIPLAAKSETIKKLTYDIDFYKPVLPVF